MNRLAEQQQRLHPVGRILGIAGGLIVLVSIFLPWAFSFGALDGMSLIGNPSPLQRFGGLLGLTIAVLIICSQRVKPSPTRKRVGWVRGAKAAATGIGPVPASCGARPVPMDTTTIRGRSAFSRSASA